MALTWLWMMRKSPGISEKGRFHPLFGMASSRGAGNEYSDVASVLPIVQPKST